jgi:flagellar hook-associated protein 3 FlgL
MRVTENGMALNYLTNINQAREKIVDLQAQVAAGKRVLKPSDDPVATGSILRLQAALSQNARYANNIEAGRGIADSTAGALDSLSTVLTNLKDVVTRAYNGSATETLSVSADNVDQLLSEAVDIANTKFNGKYIFGGTQTLAVPYTLSADRSSVSGNPAGLDGAITYPVGDSVNQQVNITGEEAFQGTGLFDLIIQIRDTMKSGNPPTAIQVDSIDSALDHILECGGKAGAISQSLDTLSTNLDQQKTQLTEFLSNVQDADIAESLMKLQNDQLMLNAAINTAAQVLPKSLLDFLK